MHFVVFLVEELLDLGLRGEQSSSDGISLSFDGLFQHGLCIRSCRELVAHRLHCAGQCVELVLDAGFPSFHFLYFTVQFGGFNIAFVDDVQQPGNLIVLRFLSSAGGRGG